MVYAPKRPTDCIPLDVWYEYKSGDSPLKFNFGHNCENIFMMVATGDHSIRLDFSYEVDFVTYGLDAYIEFDVSIDDSVPIPAALQKGGFIERATGNPISDDRVREIADRLDILEQRVPEDYSRRMVEATKYPPPPESPSEWVACASGWVEVATISGALVGAGTGALAFGVGAIPGAKAGALGGGAAGLALAALAC